MKSFMKLLVTIIVVAVLGFTVGYLMMNGSKNSNGEGERLNNTNQLDMEQDKNVNSGENIDDLSGEQATHQNTLSKEEIIEMIDRQTQAIDYNEVNNSVRDSLTRELVTSGDREFMDYFKIKEITVAVNVSNGRIEIIPDSDFVENMVYYYDGAGNLIMFENVSTTVGGSCKYYFDNNSLIEIKVAYDEEIEIKPENAEDILNRAQAIYDRYVK